MLPVTLTVVDTQAIDTDHLTATALRMFKGAPVNMDTVQIARGFFETIRENARARDPRGEFTLDESEAAEICRQVEHYVLSMINTNRAAQCLSLEAPFL